MPQESDRLSELRPSVQTTLMEPVASAYETTLLSPEEAVNDSPEARSTEEV